MPNDERIAFVCSITRSLGLAVDVTTEMHINFDIPAQEDFSLAVVARVTVEVEL